MRLVYAAGVAALLVGCGGGPPPPPQTVGSPPPPFEPPVVTNPESPVSYPADLYEQQAEGTVVLRLFVDERGTVTAESTRVSETSGYAGLDSAALKAVPDMRFAPARRDGRPVATSFLQPVHFRHTTRAGVTTQP